MSEKLVNFNVDEETYELAKNKLEYGEMSELLRQTVRGVAVGTDTTERERKQELLEDKRKAVRDIDREIDDLENDKDEILREIERIERRLNELLEQDGEYDGVLAMLEEDLHSGVRILGGSDKVAKAAQIGDCSREDVVADLKERNPDVPEKAFRPAELGEPAAWNSDNTESLL